MFKKTQEDLQFCDALIQALTNENIDYFYQLKEAGNLSLELLNMSLRFCGNHYLSWPFTQKIIALGANNFRAVLVNSLWQQNYALARHLFEIQPHINPLETEHYSSHSLSHITNLIDKINSNVDIAHLFACIVRSLPNHTQMISDDKVYCRGMNEEALQDYGYIYNELLATCLRKTYQDNTNTYSIGLSMAIVIRALAQRSFSLNQENKAMLLDIRETHSEIYALFSRRMKKDYEDNNHIHDDFIEEIDEEFYSTDMAQRKLGIYQFWDNGHEINRQKFRVYIGLARHLNAPHSLNQTIWEALCRCWSYKARSPNIEEYHFLKTLKKSTANHQTLLNFFNRYIHFEPIYQNDLLAQKLDNSLAVHMGKPEDEFRKI